MDVPAPLAGTVAQLRVKIGDRVSEGSVLLHARVERATRAQPEQPPAAAPAAQPPAVVDGAAPLPLPGRRLRRPARRARSRDRRLHAPPSAPPTSGLGRSLVERYEKLGGVCLNVGCIPSKALLHAARVIAEARGDGRARDRVRPAEARSSTRCGRGSSRSWTSSPGASTGSRGSARSRSCMESRG